MLGSTSTKGAIFPVDPVAKAAAEFGINPDAIRVINLSLDTAIKNYQIDVTGSVVWAYEASSLNASISLRLQSQNNDKITVKKGFFLGGVRFSHLIVDAVAQSGEYVTLFVVREGVDALRVVNPSSDFTNITESKPTVNGSQADVTVVHKAAAVKIWTAVADGRDLLISSVSGPTIRISDSNVGAARGTPLPGGNELTLPASVDWWAYNDDVGTDTVIAFSYTAD